MIPQHLLWLDLETTGLYPGSDHILEVAAFTAPLKDPFKVPSYSEEPGQLLWVNEAVRFKDWSEQSDEIVEMHSRNNLIADCVKAKRSIIAIELDLLKLVALTSSACSGDQLVLAGSSVHFDLAFIREHMQTLASNLSYRTYDVSSIRNFCYSLGMPEMPPLDPKPHRAKDDLMASIKLGQYCAEWLQKTSYPGAGS